MRRVGTWITGAALLAPLVVSTTGCGSEGSAPEPARHVLVILVDTLRADALGAYGAPEGATPALDAFAAQSAVFLQAHTQGSFTASSVTALMCGRRIAEESVKMLPGPPALAEQFQAGGFATAAFICNDIISEQSGYARGFDSMLQLPPYSENTEIIAWFRAHADTPTFAYVHLNEAHDPYAEEEHAWPQLRLDPPPLPAARHAYYEALSDELGLVDLDAAVAHIETEVGGYADDVTYSDARIAELLAAAREAWPAEGTVIVITSDHGEGLWTRVAMLSGKRRRSLESGAPQTLVTTLMPTHGNQVNRELTHVPLIVHAPGIEPARIDGLVESIDIFPTLLELADLPLPTDLPGESLVARMHGAADEAGDAFTFTRFNASLLTADGWQLIRPTELGMCEESIVLQLFDLGSDPEARVNVAAQHPEVVGRLEALVVERLRAGLTGFDQELSSEDMTVLKGLGYLDAGIVERVQAEFQAKPTEELIAILSQDPKCLARLESVRALRGRELTSEQRAGLEARLGLEGSPAVRGALERALGE